MVVFTPTYGGWLRSCVNAIGIVETARRLGISQVALWNIRNGKRRKIKRSTARAIVTLRTEINLSGEKRHRDSILHGAYLRNRTEKKVVYRKDLYRKDGDVHTEGKRSWRSRGD